MSETSERMLATFDTLPQHEQHELITALLRRSGELPNQELSEDGLVGLADGLFQALDAEESHGDSAGSR